MNAFAFSAKFGKLDEKLRVSISQELELIRASTTTITDFYGIKWLKPKPPTLKISPEKPISGMDKKRKLSERSDPSNSSSAISTNAAKRARNPEPTPRTIHGIPASGSGGFSLLTTISEQTKEMDPGILSRRQTKITDFKDTDNYKFFELNADETVKLVMRTPPYDEKYIKERTYHQKVFEWQNQINEW